MTGTAPLPKQLRNVARRYKSTPTTEEIAEAVRAAVDDGHRQTVIAAAFGVSRQQVGRWVHGTNYDGRRPAERER